MKVQAQKFLSAVILGASITASSFAAEAQNDWTILASESQLDFSASYLTKGNGTALENLHTIADISGGISNNSKATVMLNLTTLSSEDKTRTKFIKNTLLKTSVFPVVKISSKLPKRWLYINVGSKKAMKINLSIELHGHSIAKSSYVTVKRMDLYKYKVIGHTSINIMDFGLGKGLKTLTKIAGYDSISTEVPVDFNLTFIK